jgi:hypothetical protein
MLRNKRGQSIGISQLILSLVVGAIVIYLIQVMGDAILPGAQSATTNSTANQATGWLMQFQDMVAIVIMLISFFSIIVLAVYRSEIR